MATAKYGPIGQFDDNPNRASNDGAGEPPTGPHSTSARLTPQFDSDDESDLGLSSTGTDIEGSIRMRRISKDFEKDEQSTDDDSEDESYYRTGGFRRSSGSTTHSFMLYTPDEERTVIKKFDRRVVLFMAVLYMLSFLDRSNIGNAKVAGLTVDLNLSSAQYEWLLTAFYITYILFEWMTILYRIIPPHIYISACVLSWGLLASLQSVATSFAALVVLRALLGVGEAAFGPGVPFYLSFFYKREELAMRTGLFISAAPLAISFAGSLAYFITKHEGGPISPWRLLFLVEGIPSVFVAVFAWTFIPDSPGKADFLTKRQKKVAKLRLRREKSLGEGDQRGGINWREIVQTLADPKCYLTAFMFLSCNVAFSSLPVFLPTIIHEMGHSASSSQALTAPPYLVAFIAVLVTAFLSDRLRDRSLAICIHALLGAFGYLLIAIAGRAGWGTTWQYVGVYPATVGFFSAITIIITWTINNQESDSKKGTGVAILNVIGQCGPLVGTHLYPAEDGPLYTKGMAICSGFMFFVFILALALRIFLRRENQRRDTAFVQEGRGDSATKPLRNGGQKEQFRFIL
ncbi:MAG: hypothetical protein M1837_006998 [Sclerophora amabilis]|nr:MAG: hypothetical protein M1837_006998 [Sclerophora amabilis]